MSSRINELASQMAQMQKSINDMQLKMNEEKKENDDDRFDKIMNEIKSMKQNINKLTMNNNINPEQQKLKSWLEDKVKLPEYYDIFIENGIEDLSTASLLTMEGIEGMGIDKVGHQMKILSQVVKLKQPVNNEGGTAYVG